MQKDKHWAVQKEFNGAIFGIRLMLFLYGIGGRYLFVPILYVVIFVYYILSPKQRQYSKAFFNRVEKKRAEQKLEHHNYSVYRHFLSFGKMLLEKLIAWRNEIKIGRDAFYTENSKENIFDFSSGGKVFLCSHLGNVECLRALGFAENRTIINAVIFTGNGKKFHKIYKAIDPNSSLNIIATESFGPDTAIMLKEKIDKGEIVAIVGDRIPVNSGRDNSYRVVEAEFLGEKCLFPEGPFILSSILNCKVQLLLGLKNETTDHIDIVCENFANPLKLSRKDRKKMGTGVRRKIRVLRCKVSLSVV
ncbi:MAG: hypothetical protein ACI4M9_00360 [Succinivibrio sp.]